MRIDDVHLSDWRRNYQIQTDNIVDLFINYLAWKGLLRRGLSLTLFKISQQTHLLKI